MRFGVLAPMALVATSTLAAAEGRDPAAADALFRQAREALSKGDYATACPKFAESQRLDPAAGTLMNIAECEEHSGALGSALEHWREAADQLSTSPDDRLELAHRHIADLEPRVPRLTIRLERRAPPDTKVTRDGVELGSASLGAPLPVNPGRHTVVATAPGRAAATKTVTLAEAQVLDLVVAPGAPVVKQEPGSSGWRTVGWVAGGVGLAALGAAAVTGVIVMDENSIVERDCPSKQCSQSGLNAATTGKTLLVVNAIAWVVGVVGVGGGVALLLTTPAGDEPSTRIAPTASASGGGLSIVRSFW
jgi:hypothetical protein